MGFIVLYHLCKLKTHTNQNRVFHKDMCVFKCVYTGFGRSNTCLSVAGRAIIQGNNTDVINYSFNLNILHTMSYGVFECDIVMLQNYMLMIL